MTRGHVLLSINAVTLSTLSRGVPSARINDVLNAEASTISAVSFILCKHL